MLSVRWRQSGRLLRYRRWRNKALDGMWAMPRQPVHREIVHPWPAGRRRMQGVGAGRQPAAYQTKLRKT